METKYIKSLNNKNIRLIYEGYFFILYANIIIITGIVHIIEGIKNSFFKNNKYVLSIFNINYIEKSKILKNKFLIIN